MVGVDFKTMMIINLVLIAAAVFFYLFRKYRHKKNMEDPEYLQRMEEAEAEERRRERESAILGDEIGGYGDYGDDEAVYAGDGGYEGKGVPTGYEPSGGSRDASQGGSSGYSSNYASEYQSHTRDSYASPEREIQKMRNSQSAGDTGERRTLAPEPEEEAPMIPAGYGVDDE